MSQNHHAAKASELIIANQCGGSFIDPTMSNYLAAQAEATLAIAHEQRTANLIALYGYGDIVDLETITERLGLA